MTNAQFKAFIESIKIILEHVQDVGELKSALDRIQSTLEQPK